jgi:ligand-binding sensor protein
MIKPKYHAPSIPLATAPSARFNKARAACLRAQTDASQEPDSTTRTITWFAGLSESAVPVHVGDHILGFLETGEVLAQESDKETLREHYSTAPRLGLQDGLEAT